MFGNTGIDRRYSCVPIEWYEQLHEWPERNQVYLDSAIDLLEDATRRVLERANGRPDDIDAVVAVSTTGIATPSLDALLMERMNLRRNVQRLPIFGLGCAGGAIGLRGPPRLRARILVRWCSFSSSSSARSAFVGTTFQRATSSRPRSSATAPRRR